MFQGGAHPVETIWEGKNIRGSDISKHCKPIYPAQSFPQIKKTSNVYHFTIAEVLLVIGLTRQMQRALPNEIHLFDTDDITSSCVVVGASLYAKGKS